jgi:hypothetical protein
LIIFLFRLRTANSSEVTATLFGISQQWQVSHYCCQVLRAFETDVLPSRFGVGACSRECLIKEHCTKIVNALH